MRHRSGWATLAAMKITSPEQRLTLDAGIHRPVTHGTLAAATGAPRDFHGGLELKHALDFWLGVGSAAVVLGPWTELLDRVPVGQLEDGCERRSPLFVDRRRTLPVRLG